MQNAEQPSCLSLAGVDGFDQITYLGRFTPWFNCNFPWDSNSRCPRMSQMSSINLSSAQHTWMEESRCSASFLSRLLCFPQQQTQLWASDVTGALWFQQCWGNVQAVYKIVHYYVYCSTQEYKNFIQYSLSHSYAISINYGRPRYL